MIEKITTEISYYMAWVAFHLLRRYRNLNENQYRCFKEEILPYYEDEKLYKQVRLIKNILKVNVAP